MEIDSKFLDFYFSYAEEIDFHLICNKNKSALNADPLSFDERSIILIEMIENSKRETQRQALQEILLHSLGFMKTEEQNSIEDEESSNRIPINLERGKKFCKVLYSNDCLLPLNLFLTYRLKDLQNLSAENCTEFDKLEILQLEHDLRLCLNILFLIIFHNSHEEEFLKEITDPIYKIEENCFKAFKLSLDLAIVPIKKFLILFYFYILFYFGKPEKSKPEHKNLIIDKQFYSDISKEESRYFLKTTSNTEEFYRRHITKENPIPQVLVVGILRVLLTTCPNASKNSGGIDLHREWVSPLVLKQKLELLFEGFESSYFKKREDPEFTENDLKTKTLEELQKEKEDQEHEPLSDKKEYECEYNRHRIIVSYIIAKIFLLFLSHLRNNHVIQYIYVSQLIVDANGALVILKFLNQDLTTIKFLERTIIPNVVKVSTPKAEEQPKNNENKEPNLIAEGSNESDSEEKKGSNIPEQKEELKEEKKNNSIYSELLEEGIFNLLSLLYKLSNNQAERIKSYLVQYKAPLIMKRIYSKFKNQKIQKNALKTLKIQIKYLPKKWREANMKTISAIYDRVTLCPNDDWLFWEGWNSKEEEIFNQEQIRNMNNEFNFKNYWQHFDKEANLTSEEKEKQALSWVEQQYKECKLDAEFCNNYEEWLENEIWGYYD